MFGFRVIYICFCRIYRMEEENIHITGSEPEEVVLLKYIHDEVSEEERAWVESWLKEEGTRNDILLQLASIDYALYTKQRIESRNSLEAYSKVEKHIRLRQTRKWINRACLIAACFVGGLLFSTAISYWMREPAKTERQIITVQANAGMRTSFNLPDGTVAYLNSGSVLSYPLPYDKKERRVTLTGEAYFKVARNLEQPFIVSVANDRMRVKVLGTEFNIQAYKDDDEVQTTLVSGSINIGMKQSNNVLKYQILSPSEKATYNLQSRSIDITCANVESEIAWKDGVLIFKDMALPLVMKELSYFYNVKFQVLDPVINSYRFTGTFKNRQLSQILDYLQISSHVGYSIKQMVADDSLTVQQESVLLYKK